jgi:hypothetical protein
VEKFNGKERKVEKYPVVSLAIGEFLIKKRQKKKP